MPRRLAPSFPARQGDEVFELRRDFGQHVAGQGHGLESGLVLHLGLTEVLFGAT